MLCSRCQAHPAVVHFESAAAGKKVKADLCETCAKEAGVPWASMGSAVEELLAGPLALSSTSPAFTELLQLLSQWTPRPVEPSVHVEKCPRCAWTLSEFQKTGKMGCPDCYSAFRNETAELLSRIHGSGTHHGKRISAKAKTKETVETMAELQQRLQKAVKDEKYELAAEIRDQIRQREGQQP
jgi:protein arginine kinase activator